MRNTIVEKLEREIEKEEIEMVEKKGKGHPDTICDGVCENSSRLLSQYYLKKFKTILHHNLDKGLLVAGKSKPKFGGGKILKPIKIIVAGRATDKVGKTSIPVKEICQKAIFNWLKENINLSQKQILKSFKIYVDYQPGAANLQEVFKRKNKIPLANDTSFGVAHAPFSRAEKITLDLGNFLNSKKIKKIFPFLGDDIKVMTLRIKDNFVFTLALPFVDKKVKSVKDYFIKKEKVKNYLSKWLKKNYKFCKNFDLKINSLDNKKATSEGEIYLTVIGLSAEQGDDGQVGRGNRVCGLITPSREMSMEAAAGKNINHPGKLYQILSFLIAQRIAKLEGVKECSVKILSEIGKPLDQPQSVHIKVFSNNLKKIKGKCEKIVDEVFENLLKIQREIVEGKYSIF